MSPIVLPSQICIYCGELLKGVGKGEHVVQEALGCKVTLKQVCVQCNGRFSQIDKELVSKSPLVLVARDVLKGKAQDTWGVLKGKAQDTWDYDPDTNHVLEARVLPGYLEPGLWPQVILSEGKAPMFRADADEMLRIGPEKYFREFYRLLMDARNDLRSRKKRPRWIWVIERQAPRRGIFPPRVFTRNTFKELDDKTHFECKYPPGVDQARILAQLDEWRPLRGRLKFGQSWGVKDPEAKLSFRPSYVLRALVKIGINLLAWCCEKTVVNKDSFPDAVDFVLNDRCWPEAGRSFERSFGFVVNEDIADLKSPDDVHKFRLTHAVHWGRDCWRLDCAFFGGRVGAVVAFPGPNYETWRTAIIAAPVGAATWSVERFETIVIRRMRIELGDLSKIIPSIPIANPEWGFRLERRKEKS